METASLMATNYFNFLCLFIFLGMSLLKFQEGCSSEPEYFPLTSDFSKSEIFQHKDFPRNFRTSADEIDGVHDSFPRLDGLKELDIAGTGQFNEEQLLSILYFFGKRVVVIDLREETHLMFEDSSGKHIPITAYGSQNSGNEGKSYEEIAIELSRYKTHIYMQDAITLHFTEDSEVIFDEDDPQFYVGRILTEEEMVADLNKIYPNGVDYSLLPVTDHKIPDDQTVDRFLQLFRKVKDRKDNTIILFHCKAGRGRTGLFMNIADILANAASYNLPLDEIIKRQELLGSPNFLELKEGREENSVERYHFLKKFYDFVISEDGYQSGASFKEWNSRLLSNVHGGEGIRKVWES
jgi:hypothetical protein